MKIQRICVNCDALFEADTREINRGNAKYCTLKCAGIHTNKNRVKIKQTCINCNEEFESVKKAKFCSNSCKQKNYRKKQNNRSENIKTIYRQIQHLPCCLCGWKEATRDIHHIIPVSKGGTNDLSNLVVLCPNHHRMAHSNLISEDILKDANIRTISSPSDEGQDAVGLP